MPGERKESASCFVPGAVIVEFSEEVADRLIDGRDIPECISDALNGLGATSMERLIPDAGEWEPRHREAGLHRFFRISYDPSARPATKATGDFSSLPGVVSAEPDRRIRRTSFFNDPMASKQWALYNDGSLGDKYKAGIDINVTPVWEMYTAGSSSVTVAIIDEGVQMDHPDLRSACIPVAVDGSRSFVYDEPEDIVVPGDHGTHVAGIIGAVNNNGTGISSIAGGYDGKGGVKILSCEIFREVPDNPDSLLQGNIYQAMVWAADHGALIANNSWGYVFDSEEEALSAKIGYEKRFIDYFINNAGCDTRGNQLPGSLMKGGLVVFAAGNDGFRMGWPAAYEPVVAVGAVGATGERSYYSNYGDWVDICAPGGDREKGSFILSTVADGKYDDYQGTSMACPFVSGVAALIVSRFGGPGFTNDMLKERLIGGANASRGGKNVGPMLDARGSFAFGGIIPPDRVEASVESKKSNSVTLSFPVPADEDDIKAYSVSFFISGDRQALESLASGSPAPDGVREEVCITDSAKAGETVSFRIGGLTPETDYYISASAADYIGNHSAFSDIIAVRTLVNHDPVVIRQAGNIRLAAPGESVELNLADYLGDEDDDELVYSISDTPSKVVFTNEVRGKLIVSAVNYGLATLSVTARDILDRTCTMELKVLVEDKSHPVTLYPNPVKSVLYITTAAEGEYTVTVSNKAGAPVYSGTVAAGPFDPYAIDLSGCPSGIYSVLLKGLGEDKRFTIAKL
ncbi:MAG: S8 family serine peptidase [Bacteroidales bacterium]|nr:S8 family serine peptidase [Bacteroidales bacterium]